MEKKEVITRLVKDFLLNAGALAVGVSTPETLAGGPPSTDLNYVLPQARAAVTFALPLDQAKIESFLRKKDPAAHNLDNRNTNFMASGIALGLAAFLNGRGRQTVALASNNVYRPDAPGGKYAELPDISHRYLAVASGLAHFGFSGNVIRGDVGAAFILGGVVTQADLMPDQPLPPEDNYCDRCKLCLAACASGLMAETELTTVSMGGREFSYAKRRTYTRCDYVCGGFAGLHPSGKWSTWSPARFRIPEKDEDFSPALMEAVEPYRRRPKQDWGFFHPLIPGSEMQFTCGHCQLLCHPDKAVRRQRYNMICESGVVIQHLDGRLEAVSPQAARKHLAAMGEERRALYQKMTRA